MFQWTIVWMIEAIKKAEYSRCKHSMIHLFTAVSLNMIVLRQQYLTYQLF